MPTWCAYQVPVDTGLAAMNLHGGEGYMRQHPWEPYMHDALGLIGGQGAQELLLIQLGQHVTFEITQRQLLKTERGRQGAADERPFVPMT
jgi:hypothetical protein